MTRRAGAAAGLAVFVGTLSALVVVSQAPWQERASRVASDGSGSSRAKDGSVARPARTGATDLRLLVADAPAPYVLDVERGSVERVAGLPTQGERGVSVAPVGEHALVLSERYCRACPPVSEVYFLRHASTAAAPLGRAIQAVPSRDGDAVWMLTRLGSRRCAIRSVGLDGRARRPPRQVSCRTGLVADLPTGLLSTYAGPLGRNAHAAVLQRRGGIARLPYEQARPVAGDVVLTGADASAPLALRDVRTGATRRLRWPSGPGYSLAEVAGDAVGALAIVAFAKYSPEHRLDLWLLDLLTRRWTRLPGMPAHLVPKVTDVKWTGDGRVVILSGNVLAVWRPGEPRLDVRRVRGPKQPGVKFVVW